MQPFLQLLETGIWGPEKQSCSAYRKIDMETRGPKPMYNFVLERNGMVGLYHMALRTRLTDFSPHSSYLFP